MKRLRKKAHYLGLTILMLISTFSTSFTPIFANSDATEVVVDPNIEYQVHEGFGTSLAWWGNVIGGWPEQEREQITDLIFDTEDGLGFNIVRYNIGGGDNPDLDPYLRPGGDVPGFQPEQGVWDWDADENQRWLLLAAKERAGEDFISEAFSNSPPYWMNYTNDVEGNEDKDNLMPEYYEEFADYLTEVVKHYQDVYGINFRTLEPFNEPELAWGSPSHSGQEGSHFQVSTQETIIKMVYDQLKEKDLNTVISTMDGATYANTINQFNQYSDETKSYIDQINSHGYTLDTSGMRDLNKLGKEDEKRIWMSEVDGGGAEGAWASYPLDPEDMVPALNMSKQVYQTFKELKPSAWVFWQAVENWAHNIDAEHNWGLIHANYEGEGAEGLEEFAFTTNKKFYTMGQYSKFIRPGDIQVDIDQDQAVAFINKEDDKLVIVQTNDRESDIEYSYDLSEFNAESNVVEVYRTSADEDIVQLDNVELSADKTLNATALAQSVTTYVINDISKLSEIKIVSELPDVALLEEEPNLPEEIVIAIEDEEQTVAVDWKIDRSQFDNIGEVSVTGVIPSLDREVMVKMMVIPAHVKYFVNPGDEPTADYLLMTSYMEETLLNKEVTDQPYDPDNGNTWGYSGGTTSLHIEGNDIYSSLRHITSDSDEKSIKYTFDVEDGNYTIFAGFYDPWSQYAQGNRKADVSINDVLTESEYSYSDQYDVRKYEDIEVSQGKLEFKIEPSPSVADLDNSDPQISWMMVVDDSVSEPKEEPVTGVQLDLEKLDLKVGEKAELTATVTPEEATNKEVLWSSDNEEVATVDENGQVTGVSAGTTEITVTTVDGEYQATVEVIVEEKESDTAPGTPEEDVDETKDEEDGQDNDLDENDQNGEDNQNDQVDQDEQDDPTNTENGHEKENDERLPETATSTFNILLAGLLLLVLGSVFLIRRRA